MKTFEPNKTITELWIDTTRKFVVVEWYNWAWFKEWDILELIRDENDPIPMFKRETWLKDYIALSRLYYADEQEQEKPKKTISWTATTSEWVTYTEDTIYESWYDEITIESAKEQVKEWRAKATKYRNRVCPLWWWI